MILVTQSAIANRVGITKQAVAYALSNRSELHRKLNPETRRRVLETAEALGYVPHNAARRLARTRSPRHSTSFDQVGLISLIAPNVDVDWVCHAMMGGAEHELSKLHASIFFVRIGEDADWKKVERMTRAGGVDGWLLYGPVNDEVVDRIKPSKLPFVILGDHRCTQPVHCVNVDNEATGRMAVEHLAALGHRRIGFVDTKLQFAYQEQTLAAFRARVKGLGLCDDERLIVHDPPLGSEPGGERLSQWLRAEPRPTAVFIPEVDLAVAMCGVLKDLQVEVPKAVSVLTCDPVSVIARNQGYTRIELPMVEVGKRGALVLHRLASEPRVGSSETKISPSLVQGWSTCPPSG